MKLLLSFLTLISLNVLSQNQHMDTLNQGECWNIDYQYSSDLDLKKYRLEIQYLNESEFLVRHVCMVADSFSIYNRATFLGRSDNPYDTTLLESELAFIRTNKILLNVPQPFSLELFKTIEYQSNIDCLLHYSKVSVSETSFAMKQYHTLLIEYKKLLEESSDTSAEGFFNSQFCTIGCEGCFVEGKVQFSGEFKIAEKLDHLE